MASIERKKCEACGSMCASTATTCWNCGHAFGEQVSEEEKERVVTGQVAAPEARSVENGGTENNGNVVAIAIKVMAGVIYALAFILGVVLGHDLRGEFSFGLALVYWVAGAISGTLLLGFSEVIRLLHEINQKTK
ncbi:MAG: hypothetical protein II069_03880 [Oscillospiraceae bacterium]|nr:hypothetical protein [Oscillospiraceae bacterium]MBQ2061603.1 hypothetical protein [Oscillospiraceae bacterium]